MNKTNLQRMADFIRTIPQEKFDMKMYRRTYFEIMPDDLRCLSYEMANIDWENPVCNSVGCVIGHCTALDPELYHKAYKQTEGTNMGAFRIWSEEFTGIGMHSPIWRYLFGVEWGIPDFPFYDNTPEGAADRIEYVIEHDSVPPKWKEQISNY